MKFLIVSYFSPPFNGIASVRVGKTAKYLNRHGHKVKILTAQNQLGLRDDLPIEIPKENIHATRWLNLLGKLPDVSLRWRKFSILIRKLMDRLIYPDIYIGWVPFSIVKGVQICNSWKPDVLLVSFGPVSSLLTGAIIHFVTGIPYVVEFRDLWVGNHYRKDDPIRKIINVILERVLLSRSIGLASVSQALVSELSSRYPKKQVECIYNGFDPEDVQRVDGGITRERLGYNAEKLHIVYTGALYGRKRDPSILLNVVKRLGLEDKVRLHFYIPHAEDSLALRRLIEQESASSWVEDHGRVSHEEAIAAQRNADILLMLLTNDQYSSEQMRGVLTGKFFEYIGAERPILTIGPHGTEIEEIMLKYSLGIYISTLGEGLTKIPKMVENLDSMSKSARHGIEFFTREHQTRRLEDFVSRLLEETASNV